MIIVLLRLAGGSKAGSAWWGVLACCFFVATKVVGRSCTLSRRGLGIGADVKVDGRIDGRIAGGGEEFSSASIIDMVVVGLVVGSVVVIRVVEYVAMLEVQVNRHQGSDVVTTLVGSRKRETCSEGTSRRFSSRVNETTHK